VRLSIASLPVPAIRAFGVQHLAIAPDGSRVAHATESRLWIRRIDRTDPVVIEANAAHPFFSPDGNWVAFFLASGGEAGMKKVSVLGGTPVPLVATADRPLGGAWRADGTIVFATTTGVYEVSEDGGEPRLLVRPDPRRKERSYAWPHFLPGGQALLLTILPNGSIDRAQIALLDLGTRQVTTLLEGGIAARYAPTGHLLYAAGSTLTAIAFDPMTRRTRGTPVSLPEIEIASALDNGAADFALSETGTLLYIPPGRRAEPLTTLWWVDRQGREEPLPLAAGRYMYARISPDGTRVALDIVGANRDIWIWNLERPSLTKITGGPTEDILPEWSPDGRRLFFASDRTGTFDVYSQAADGATAERLEFAGPGFQVPVGLTPDGARLLVLENYRDLGLLDLAAPHRLESLLHSQFSEQLAAVSPDGKWIAYESNESGDTVDVFLRPLADITGRREKVSIDGGRFPMWDPTGSGDLFYVDPSGSMMAASIRLSPGLSLGRVTKLFDWEPPPREISGRRYDVSPVDGRFLLSRPAPGSGGTTDVSVVLNWFSELQERVPSPRR
jgi:serine/threonine-protein kinase